MKQVIVFGKPDQACPYCKEAKRVLDSRGISFVFIDVTEDENALLMLKNSGFRSVPQIFVAEHVGDSTCASTVEV